MDMVCVCECVCAIFDCQPKWNQRAHQTSLKGILCSFNSGAEFLGFWFFVLFFGGIDFHTILKRKMRTCASVCHCMYVGWNALMLSSVVHVCLYIFVVRGHDTKIYNSQRDEKRCGQNVQSLFLMDSLYYNSYMWLYAGSGHVTFHVIINC